MRSILFFAARRARNARFFSSSSFLSLLCRFASISRHGIRLKTRFAPLKISGCTSSFFSVFTTSFWPNIWYPSMASAAMPATSTD